MSEILTEVVPYTDDFDEMHARLTELGAAERTLDGEVAMSESTRVRAIFRAVAQPPEIIQIMPSRHANMTATVTRIGRGEPDVPDVRVGRYTYELPDDADAIFQAVVHENAPALGRPGADPADAHFNGVYENVLAFRPTE